MAHHGLTQVGRGPVAQPHHFTRKFDATATGFARAVCFARPNFATVDGRGLDANEHLARFGLGLVHLAQFNAPAMFSVGDDEGCFHGASCSLGDVSVWSQSI